MSLVWTRSVDGEKPNGKPAYEYAAAAEDREFHIVWALDHGGTFGFTAVRRDPTKPGTVEYLTPRYGISWCRTLGRCKDECEKINTKHEGMRYGK